MIAGEEKIINDLVRWELQKHDIKEELDNIKSNKIVFKINEGFLCNFTLESLLNFKAEPDERETGIKLAKAFVGAGIKIPEELFVGIFGKVFKL